MSQLHTDSPASVLSEAKIAKKKKLPHILRSGEMLPWCNHALLLALVSHWQALENPFWHRSQLWVMSTPDNRYRSEMNKTKKLSHPDVCRSVNSMHLHTFMKYNKYLCYHPLIMFGCSQKWIWARKSGQVFSPKFFHNTAEMSKIVRSFHSSNGSLWLGAFMDPFSNNLEDS